MRRPQRLIESNELHPDKRHIKKICIMCKDFFSSLSLDQHTSSYLFSQHYVEYMQALSEREGGDVMR